MHIADSRDHDGHDPDRGWRKAIKIAFAENPVIAAPAGRRRAARKPRTSTTDIRSRARGAKQPAARDDDPTHQLPLLEETP